MDITVTNEPKTDRVETALFVTETFEDQRILAHLINAMARGDWIIFMSGNQEAGKFRFTRKGSDGD